MGLGFFEQGVDTVGAQAAEVQETCFRKAVRTVATGIHIEFGREIGIHGAQVGPVVGGNLWSLKFICPAKIDDGFREKLQAVASQKLFVGIVIF